MLLLRPLGAARPAALGRRRAAPARPGRRRAGRARLGAGSWTSTWTPLRVVLAVTAPLVGAVILGAIWVAANCGVVLAGRRPRGGQLGDLRLDFATSYPITVYGPWLRRMHVLRRARRVRGLLPGARAARAARPARACPTALRYCSPLVAAAAVGGRRARLAHRRPALPGDGVMIDRRRRGAEPGLPRRRPAAAPAGHGRRGRDADHRARARPSASSARTAPASRRRSRC